MALPTTLAKAKHLWTATFYFNDAVSLKGFSERYVVGVAEDIDSPPTVYASTVPTCADLIKYRIPLMGKGCNLVWARVSSTKGGNDGRVLVLNNTSGIIRLAEDPHEGINMMGDGIMFRMETASGIHANRNVLGVRDGDIIQGLFQYDVSSYDPLTFTPDALNTGLTALKQYQNWMHVLTKQTIRARKVGSGYDIEPWSNINFRKAVSKSLGAPFGLSRHVRRI